MRDAQELRGLREQDARRVLGLPERGELVALVRTWVERGAIEERALSDAIDHLRAAEDYARESATWATGAGDGFAAVVERRTLELARAWLLALVSPADARALCDDIGADGNGVHASLAPDLARLIARLASS